MKKQDLAFIILSILFFIPFFISDAVYNLYKDFNINHPYCMAFIKFGLLATYGEVLGVRIKSGSFNIKGFGLAPKSIVWGFLGVWIAIAMKTFSMGAPVMADTLGLNSFFGGNGIASAMIGPFTLEKLVGAITISVMMNVCFAPIFMIFHKITDTHILDNGGALSTLIKPIPMASILANLNWNVQWNFVFKKTIPFFWIPAHTITFMLPSQFQVLFAAFLSIVLGVILSVAAVMGRQNK